MDGVSILGAVLSAVGAALAIWQAARAKKYRDEVLQDRRRFALVEAIGLARNAREESRKIATPVGKPVRGVDPQAVINAIRDCLDRIREDGHKFQDPGVTAAVSEAQRYLVDYVREKDESRRHTVADGMYKSLQDLTARLSEAVDRAM